MWDRHVHTAVFRMNDQKRLTDMEFCSVLCGSLNGSGIKARMDTCICICMAESLCCLSKIITLLIGYTPIYNKMFIKKKTKHMVEPKREND